MAMTAAPDDIAALKTALAAAERRADLAELDRDEAVADAARVKAEVSGAEALIAHLTLQIEKLRRELYGTRSERKARLLDQLEMQLEDAQAAASEDELAAEEAAAKTTTVRPLIRKRPSKKPFPEHLPRERVVVPAPTSCACCGSGRLSKLGEDITETLEVIPRQWKVIQTVREKFTCRECETISQPPAPFHPTPRGFLGPNLLAMILFEKFGQHQPLNRQSDRYAREGIDLSLSTLADQVGACAHALRPLHDLIERHVLAAERLHGDDTTVPILAKGKTTTGRVWVYVRDDRPFGGRSPPAALFYASRDRTAEHPERHLTGYGGILQADAYAGYGRLYDADRSPGPVTEALCWAHYHERSFIWSSYPLGPSGGVIARARAPDKARDGGGFCRRLGGRRCRSRCGQYQASSRTLPNRSGGRPDCHTARCILEAAAPSLVTVAMNAQRRPAFELHAGIAPRAVKRSAFFRIS